MTNQETFRATYEPALAKAITDYPDEYFYPVSEAPAVVAKMMAAIERGSYGKDSRALKATCKTLGIKFTYAGIAEYWNAS